MAHFLCSGLKVNSGASDSYGNHIPEIAAGGNGEKSGVHKTEGNSSKIIKEMM